MPLDDDAVRAATLAQYDTLTWNTLVSRQYTRVLDACSSEDRQLDIYLFALALRGVVRGANLAKEVANKYGLQTRVSQIDTALQGFDALVPDATHVRNILEHFDDYRLGRGRLQQRHGMKELFEWLERDGTDGGHVLVLGGRYRLPLDPAKAASDFLAHEVSRAMRLTDCDVGNPHGGDTEPGSAGRR